MKRVKELKKEYDESRKHLFYKDGKAACIYRDIYGEAKTLKEKVKANGCKINYNMPSDSFEYICDGNIGKKDYPIYLCSTCQNLIKEIEELLK